MKRFKVILPINVADRIYQYGESIELDLETAQLYSHALMALAEPTTGDEGQDGRDK